MYLYCTADQIGSEHQTGAGHVCHNELTALRTLGEVLVFSGPEITWVPFEGDKVVCEKIKPFLGKIKLAHFYSGTFTETVRLLKESGARVTYTVAAHSIEASRQAFEDMGWEYNFPHLTQSDLLEKYIGGYKLADLVIAPSTHSKVVLNSQGCKNVVIIPHGCYLPEKISPLPKTFTCGYLGSVCGPDKGIIHLIKAWKQLNYQDALLVLAGKDSTSDIAIDMVRKYGGGSIQLSGWQTSPSDLYNRCSIYIQPSATEGFSCEVPEAMAHGRPVICSTGAGASELIVLEVGMKVPPRNPDALTKAIDVYKINPELISKHGEIARTVSKDYSWDKIRTRYIKTWERVI